MPIRKVGSDTPSSDKVMNAWLMKVPRLSAAYTPMGMPTTRASKAATRASSSVAGKRSAISARHLGALAQAQAELTLRRIHQKVPELHEKGFVQPQIGAQLRICSGVASCPSRNTTGSPTYWNSMKAMKATVTITMTA
jgi:hypothetical protein